VSHTRLVMIFVRLSVVSEKLVVMQAAIFAIVGRSMQESGSLAPMSMVISDTWPRWPRRKSTAWASCERAG
jgi:hypothetical protein